MQHPLDQIGRLGIHITIQLILAAVVVVVDIGVALGKIRLGFEKLKLFVVTGLCIGWHTYWYYLH